jgi:hypothetical protein
MLPAAFSGTPPMSDHSARTCSHNPPSIEIGVFAHFRIASGFGEPFLPPRSAGVSCGRIQRQMLK